MPKPLALAAALITAATLICVSTAAAAEPTKPTSREVARRPKYSYASHLDLQTGRVVLETDAPASVTEGLVKEHPEIELRDSKPVGDLFNRRDDIAPFWGRRRDPERRRDVLHRVHRPQETASDLRSPARVFPEAATGARPARSRPVDEHRRARFQLHRAASSSIAPGERTPPGALPTPSCRARQTPPGADAALGQSMMVLLPPPASQSESSAPPPLRRSSSSSPSSWSTPPPPSRRSSPRLVADGGV